MKPSAIERIACPCWVLQDYATHCKIDVPVVVPIPVTSLVMDHYNEQLALDERFGKLIENRVYFITTHGRVVNPKEALKVAIHAQQIDDDNIDNVNGLQAHHIWKRNK